VIDRLTSALDEQHVRSGQKLFSVGEVPPFVYFMQDGQVRMVREGSAPWTFRGRWVLGAFDAHVDRPSSRDGVALSDFYIMKLNRSVWLDLLEDSFPLARGALFNSATTVARLEERVRGNVPRPTETRALAPPASARSLDLVERLAFLIDRRMFSDAGVQTIADLAMVAREVAFGTGEVALYRGVDREHLQLVVDGSIHAEREDPQVVREYGPGDLVCGAAAFGKSARAWKATAAAPARVLQIPIEAWLDLMEEHFDLLRSALAALALRREALLERLAVQIDDLILT
jgi:CRP-like cAMP-binding protein